jgi:serine/threonine protein kinase
MVSKVINEHEFMLLKMASEAKIAPKIKKITELPGNRYRIILAKYPMTLEEFRDQGGDIEEFEDRINKLIKDLHFLGIFHGDLHANNIVIDPDNGLIKIIDFGKSILFREFKDNPEKYLKEYTDFLEPDEPFDSLDDMLEFEETMYKITL